MVETENSYLFIGVLQPGSSLETEKHNKKNNVLDSKLTMALRPYMFV